MRTIFFILAEFPPINSAGVYRPIRFVNACAEKGYRVVVITFLHDENLVWPSNKLDNNIISLLNKKVIIERIPLSNISLMERNKWLKFFNTYFFVTDKFASAWKKNILQAFPSLIKKYNPSQIVTSVPPFSIANLVKEIAVKNKIPFILDLRDAWSQLAMSPNGTYLHYLKKWHVEKVVFKNASAIISVTPQLINVLKNTQPSINNNKFYNIFNSFNVNNLNYDIATEFLIKQKDEKIHIGYIGTFYFDMETWQNNRKPWYRKRLTKNFHFYPIKEDWLFRTPYYFFRILNKLIESRVILEDSIIFHYIGCDGAIVHELAKKVKLNISIVDYGYCTQKKVSVLQNTFDLLLATSEKVIGKNHYCLPSKLFRYLETNKPIIGFVTNGIQKEFIEKSRAGLTFNPEKEEESANKLEQLFKAGFKSNLNMDYLTEFSNQFTNAQFISILEKSFLANSFMKG